jgi:hypothetical protein
LNYYLIFCYNKFRIIIKKQKRRVWGGCMKNIKYSVLSVLVIGLLVFSVPVLQTRGGGGHGGGHGGHGGRGRGGHGRGHGGRGGYHRGWGHGGYYGGYGYGPYYDGWGWGTGIGLGTGLVVGSALASEPSDPYYAVDREKARLEKEEIHAEAQDRRLTRKEEEQERKAALKEQKRLAKKHKIAEVE